MRRTPLRRGVAALEFLLTAGFLLLIVAGIVELSLLMQQSHLVTRAARDAARTGAGVSEGSDPTGDEIEAAAIEHALFALQAAGIDCDSSCELSAEWFEHPTAHWMLLRVEVGVPYAPLMGLLPGVPTMTRSDFVALTQQQLQE